jgi:GxxExxY protein
VDDDNELSRRVIGCAIEVHRHLGPGLLESAYEECLCHELSLERIAHERQVALPVTYKGLTIAAGYRLDVLVDRRLILEIKAVDRAAPVHEAQLLTYLRLSGLRLGLVLNFNQAVLRDGIKRITN